MVLCIIVGCGSRSDRNSDRENISFFSIPKLVSNQGVEHEKLTEERRRLWIAAISRGDTTTKNILQTERVCSRHFVSGRAAPVWDRYNVDWTPTLNLGRKEYVEEGTKEKLQKKVGERAVRAKERTKRGAEQRVEAAAKRTPQNPTGYRLQDIDLTKVEDVPLDVEMADLTISSEEPGPVETLTTELPYLFSSKPVSRESKTSETQRESKTSETQGESKTSGTQRELKTTGTQTDEFQYMFGEPCYQAPNKDFYKSDEKVRFYTGLPSYEVLMVIFDHVAPFVTRKSQSLDSFQELMIVLIKLRLNVPLQDLAYTFQVSLATVSRIFSTWIVALDTRLSCFVSWPEREDLWRTMPMCFQYAFGRKVTVIIDCFEVFIAKPTNLLARAQTFSNYKQHNTIKVLIGITPQGSISFVSEAWGGRTSDKFLTENCGFLDKLLPGDTVLADRGFTIDESVGLKQGKLVIPAFTKGKAQLDPIDVEKSRGIASVRIHVERVIGLLRRKYTFLQGTIPTDYLVCRESEVPLIDRIIRVCSALVNFCPPIVPFD
ncbi:uncharacterized protein LOC144878628 [Branchiostoma floridae x Branchiostoma japonicum]